MKVGIVSPSWLPRHGGQQQYVHHLARVLADNGVDVSAFCAQAEQPGRDNGSFPVTRWSAPEQLAFEGWQAAALENRWSSAEFCWLYSFMDAAVAWAVAADLDVVMVNAPLGRPKFHQARELYKQLKAHGMKVGAIHHDLEDNIRNTLVQQYRKTRDWNLTSRIVIGAVRSAAQRAGSVHGYQTVGSPLFFSPDFIVSCSGWTTRFLDPFGEAPAFVLHPWQDAGYWSGLPESADGLATKNVLMVNPLPHKGQQHMAALIRDAQEDWTFRVLKGGYGNAFKTFMPLVAEAAAVRQGRVEFLDYVPDMREAYRAADVVVFPSFYEGYGMTAVEPMFAGTPVVSSNYPAVVEAVGEGAYTLCPYFTKGEQWRAAVGEVLRRKEDWRAKGAARVEELVRRQEKELRELIGFLKAL